LEDDVGDIGNAVAEVGEKTEKDHHYDKPDDME
jgi:hypothetical protein